MRTCVNEVAWQNTACKPILPITWQKSEHLTQQDFRLTKQNTFGTFTHKCRRWCTYKPFSLCSFAKVVRFNITPVETRIVSQITKDVLNFCLSPLNYLRLLRCFWTRIYIGILGWLTTLCKVSSISDLSFRRSCPYKKYGRMD